MYPRRWLDGRHNNRLVGWVGDWLVIRLVLWFWDFWCSFVLFYVFFFFFEVGEGDNVLLSPPPMSRRGRDQEVII